MELQFLLTTVIHDATGVRPGVVVYEKSITLPYVYPYAPTPFEIELPGVNLQPLTEYAFIFDAATNLNLLDDVAPRASVDAEEFDDGIFFYYKVPWETTGGIIGSRTSHFSANWTEHSLDLKFSMTFIPEPSTVALALLSVPALFALRRRLR